MQVTCFRSLQVFTVLILCFCGGAEAFFWGRMTDRKAGEIMDAMKTAYKKKDCAAVLASFKEFLGEKPSSDLKREGYRYAGLCYEEKNYVEKALNLYKLAVLLYPEDIFFHKRLGSIYLVNGFYMNSVDLFLKVLKNDDQDYEAMLSLARAYRQLGFLSRAKEYYVKCVLNRDFSDLSTAAEYAQLLLEKNDVQEAIFTLDKALVFSRTPDLLMLWARSLAYAGRYKEAASALSHAENFGPLEREARMRKVLYSVFAGEYSLEKELEYFRGDYFSYFINGILKYKKGDNENAVVDFAICAEKGGGFVKKVSLNFIERLKKRQDDED